MPAPSDSNDRDVRLARDALAIWQAGVDAVRAERLIEEAVHVDDERLVITDEAIDLRDIGRIEVVGAGKAGAGMAAGLETALGGEVLRSKQVGGWINVPADCVRELETITLHAARPAGHNEPTSDGVAGAEEILRRVGELGENDLCLCLLSGGASALLPSPAEGLTLADKQQVTKLLSSRGANIAELNTVRKQLSRIKGGRLAAACRAGRLRTLVISDVIGDPLDVIGSGPTVPDTSTSREALDILNRCDARQAGIADRVFDYLEQQAAKNDTTGGQQPHPDAQAHIIGNNARAVDAAGAEAVRRGYAYLLLPAQELEGQANEVGQQHAEQTLSMRDGDGPDCLITGGEPVVTLVDAADRGRGGRNQQLVLAALVHLMRQSGAAGYRDDVARRAADGIALLSGGTDGEDGPTDAAGALFAGSAIIDAARKANCDPQDYLSRNDAYTFFEQVGGLIKTGPTHTNVCDVRVLLVDRARNSGD